MGMVAGSCSALLFAPAVRDPYRAVHLSLDRPQLRLPPVPQDGRKDRSMREARWLHDTLGSRVRVAAQ